MTTSTGGQGATRSASLRWPRVAHHIPGRPRWRNTAKRSPSAPKIPATFALLRSIGKHLITATAIILGNDVGQWDKQYNAAPLGATRYIEGMEAPRSCATN